MFRAKADVKYIKKAHVGFFVLYDPKLTRIPNVIEILIHYLNHNPLMLNSRFFFNKAKDLIKFYLILPIKLLKNTCNLKISNIENLI